MTYYECEEGWKILIDPLVHLCESHGGTVLQVKEKYGSLSFYYSSGDGNKTFWADFDGLVNMSERVSSKVCEFCGKPGKTYFTKKDGSSAWWKTLCEEDAQKAGYI